MIDILIIIGVNTVVVILAVQYLQRSVLWRLDHVVQGRIRRLERKTVWRLDRLLLDRSLLNEEEQIQYNEQEKIL